MTTKSKTCPCHSNKEYIMCCGRFHSGHKPLNAVELMRSRYSAYALNLASYIIDTTDTSSPLYQKDKNLWVQQINTFARNTEFIGLEIKSFVETSLTIAEVVSTATFKQQGQDASFTEKSFFTKTADTWLYNHGIVSS